MSIMIGESLMTKFTGFLDDHKIFGDFNGFQHIALIRYESYYTLFGRTKCYHDIVSSSFQYNYRWCMVAGLQQYTQNFTKLRQN